MAVIPVNYEIRIEGHLDAHWSEWLDDMTITPLKSGETLLSGPLADQAALFGLLIKLHNLGLALVAVSRKTAPEDSNHPFP